VPNGEADIEAAAPEGHPVQNISIESPERGDIDDADPWLMFSHEVPMEDREHGGLGLPSCGRADEEDIATLYDLGDKMLLGFCGLLESSLIEESPNWPTEQ
jgi:hypothetical protein